MTVDFVLKSGVAVLKPRGKIYGTNTRLFEDSIYEGMDKSGNPPKMVVDFADVYGMDSTALATMMDIALTIKRKRGRLGVVNVLDLVLVAEAIGTGGEGGDVNGDGMVNVFDLVFVAEAFRVVPGGEGDGYNVLCSRNKGLSTPALWRATVLGHTKKAEWRIN